MARGRRTTVTLCAVVLFASLFQAPTAALSSREAALFERINRARLAQGVAELLESPELSEAARRHSREMAQRGRLSRPDLGSLLADQDAPYLTYVRVNDTARQVFRSLMKRPQRRETILGPEWVRLGVGMARDPAGKRWATLILEGGQPGSSPPPGPAPPTDPPPTPAPGATTPVYPIPSTIAWDCSRDVTEELNDWIASVPDNSTLAFGENACYRTERSIMVRDRVGLTFEGNGARFKRFELSPPQLRYPQGNRHWWLIGGRELTLRDIRVEGTNTATDIQYRPGFGAYKVDFEFEHAFAFHGVQGAVVENASADAVWGDGLLFQGEDQFTPERCRNVRVSGFTVDRNGRQGVALSSIDGALLENVQILHSRRAGFDLEPPPGEVHNVEIRNSYTNSLGLAFASAGAGEVSSIHIHHNVIGGDGVPWVYVKDSLGGARHDWSVHDNTVLATLGSSMPMLYFVNVDDVDVRNNVSHSGTASVYSRTAVEFQDAAGTLLVTNNDFTGACVAVIKDESTGEVLETGNALSPPSSCP